MDGFRTIDYVDLAPHQPQNAALQLPGYIEDILASTPLRGMPLQSHAAIEERYGGAMATEILLRGDGRKPEDVKAAGGFRPQRTAAGKYHMNVARHTNMKRAPSGSPTAFISTSRSMQIALEAVKKQDVSPGNGWVYAVLVRGVDVRASGTYDRIREHGERYTTAVEAIQAQREEAYDIGHKDEEKGNAMHDALDARKEKASARYPLAGFEVYHQAEVAAAVKIPWNHVLGFREVRGDCLTGPLYLREDLLRFATVEGRLVPAFRTPGGVEVLRHIRPPRHQRNELGITLATVARLADLFQISLDRRLLPHTKGYVVSLFPLVMNQDWAKFEQRMPHLFFFDTEAEARQSTYMRSLRSWGAAGQGNDGGPPPGRVYLYEIDVDAYRKSVVKLKIRNKTPDDANAWIRTTGQTANLRRLLYLFRKVDSKMVPH